MKLYALGCKVTIAHGVEAVVVGVALNPGPQIVYRVAWWHDGRRYEETVYEHECVGAEQAWTLHLTTPATSGAGTQRKD